MRVLPFHWPFLAALLPFVLMAANARAAEATSATGLVGSDRVLVIAHRGDSKAAPENTLPAFASAIKAGADLVELDYHHSADGVPIVIHDATLDRTTDVQQRWQIDKVPVLAKTVTELRQLDAGQWFGRQFSGTRLPTLDEAIDCIQAGSMTLIERKAGDARTCIELLRRKGLLDQVVVQAFDWEFLRDCRQIEPNVLLGALGRGEISQAVLDKIAATGATVVGWHQESITAESILAVHGRGWRAWAWTVDDPARAESLVEAGIDAIISNVPARIRETIQRQAEAAVGR